MRMLLYILIAFFNMNLTWASPEHCQFDQSEAESLDLSDSEVKTMVEKVVETAQENPLNAEIWQDFQELVTLNPSQDSRLKAESSFAIQSLPGCPELLVTADPQVKAAPGTSLILKNYAFEMRFTSPAGVIKEENSLGSISLNKYIVLSGNLLIEADCQSPLQCEKIVQVYTKKMNVEVFRIGTVGGSTSAGGIIQFQ